MIKRLFSYAGEYKKYVFLAPLFVILETAGELALPLLIAKIIDDGIMMGNLPMIYRIGVYMVIMAVAAVFLGAFGAKFGSYGSIGIGANLRQAEFRNISRFSFADIDYFSSASLVTRLTNDVTNVQNFVMMMIRMLWRTLAVGTLSSIVTYIFNILISIMMIAMVLLQYVRASACAERIFEVIDKEPSIEDGEDAVSELPAPAGQVEFRHVNFKYKAGGSGDDVLHDINFVARPGQTVAIVGGTGVGKSSLVNLIPRFYDVTGGEVLLDGVDVRKYPVEALRKRIGMVLQNNVLFSGTIRENLLWGDPDATEEQVIQAAKDAQAYDFIMSFPDGFDTHMEQGGVNVSGGQKQRLCIARAMLRKPAVLILDDSTSAVDSATEAAIRESFKKNLKDTTVILIAQRISSVQSADQILVLDEGTIAGHGTHDELMKSNAIYQEIYWSQQEGVSE